MTISFILMVIAFILFVLRVVGVQSKVDLVAAGLAVATGNNDLERISGVKKAPKLRGFFYL